MESRLLLLIPLILIFNYISCDNKQYSLVAQSCTVLDVFIQEPAECSVLSLHNNPNKQFRDYTKEQVVTYIHYDVNPAEGFNLLRDVYLRMAVFIRALRDYQGYENTVLVLKPFHKLYHWKRKDIIQNQVPWREFFDMNSLSLYIPVMDMEEFVKTVKPKSFNYRHFQLLHFKEMFESGNFEDKFEETECTEKELQQMYSQYDYFLGKPTSQQCIKLQGTAIMLKDVLDKFIPQIKGKSEFVYIHSAEIVLHDYWGSPEFWMARRSMRFNQQLIEIANDYRLAHFNSTNKLDKVQRPYSWKTEKSYRGAIGGNYLCAHLRRGDFIYGHERTTPTLRSAAEQIKTKLKEFNLENVFISSDCTGQEFKQLKKLLKRYKVHRFHSGELIHLLDGAVAIIDQIICSHAKVFVGTYESTFTYRIYEEREILGFRKEKTFNTFCKNEYDDEDASCQRNTVWLISY